MKLSIVIITMNRASQLKEAIQSCLDAVLPESTEIVIFDNGSTDETREIVESFGRLLGESIRYYHSDTNLGVGAGRSKGFDLAQGEYVYFLDDDAVISESSLKSFFIRSIDFLDRHREVASLSTRIVDDIWGTKRTDLYFKDHIEEHPVCMSYFGGSHFLRKGYFTSPLYIDIKYAAEELIPSITAIDNGYYHVLDNLISIDHHPKVNKWQKGSTEEKNVNFNYCVNTYVSKKILYPILIHPILLVMFELRLRRYFQNDKNYRDNARTRSKELYKANRGIKRVKVKTVCWLVSKFRLQAI